MKCADFILLMSNIQEEVTEVKRLLGVKKKQGHGFLLKHPIRMQPCLCLDFRIFDL